ncbi:MAG: hypothetical protein CM15mP25_3610 [Gammaproteobacteria bacterium]|nr:MAG: hypothetical protein CM15mP25_3610 [Gammaproteobacteria bacterium]
MFRSRSPRSCDTLSGAWTQGDRLDHAGQSRHRYTYRDCFARARQLANAMQAWDLQSGDRVATLAWNDYRHMETYYGSACSGFVCHTINPGCSRNKSSTSSTTPKIAMFSLTPTSGR